MRWRRLVRASVLLFVASVMLPRATAFAAELAKLTAIDGFPNDQFGFSVGITGDTIVVGAPGNSSTHATYVFRRSGSTWNLVV